MYHLPREQARAIVATCPNCQQYQLPSLGSGVNPRGLNSCQLWQSDVTHFPQFGQLKYIHVSVDTFSGAVFASAHPGQKAKDVIKHCLLAFTTLGVPQEIKTDNGPGYVSHKLQDFFQHWGIRHRTGIPHSPTGQSVVERAHQNIKRVLHQQRGGAETNSPVERLFKALFTISFLNNSFNEPTPPVFQHFTNLTQAKLKERPLVLVKDPESHQIQGPFPLLTWGRGYTCVLTPVGPKWIPGKFVRPFIETAPKKANSNPRPDTSENHGDANTTWKRRKRRSDSHENM